MTMIEMIQPGWRVVDSQGEEIGTVIRVDEQSIHIRRPGVVREHESSVPRGACTYVEEGRVELSLRKNEIG